MEQDTSAVRRVVFLKLRKTGGTSLASAVLFPYCIKHGLQYMAPLGWFAAHPRLVQGYKFHMMYRHFPDFPQPWAKQWLRQTIGDFKLLTMLRDPIGRAVSAFNHAAHYHGYKTFNDYWSNHHEKNHQARWLGYDGRDDTFLEQRFSMVGVTEQFNKSMLLFRRVLDIELQDMLYVEQRRDTPKVLAKRHLSDEWVARIRQTDWLDFELHDQAMLLVAKSLEDLRGLDEELKVYETALKDFSHPLWLKRGPFPIGYSADDVWAEFTADCKVRKLREMVA